MEDEGMPTFLGLDQGEGDVDIAVLSLPYELTTSYGQGTACLLYTSPSPRD